MAGVTITTTTGWIPEFWSANLLENFDKNTVMAPIVDRSYEAMLVPGGDKVSVPDIDLLSASKLTNMTGTLSTSTISEGQTVIDINVLAYVDVLVDSASRVQNTLPLMELYTAREGQALALQFDTDILVEMDGTANTVGADAVAVGDDLILSTRASLDNNDNPHMDRFFVVSPETLVDLFKVDRYANQLYAASTSNLDGSKGRGFAGHIYDFDIYETTNTPTGSSGNKNFMYHKTGIAAVVQKEITTEVRQPNNQLADRIISWMIYGVKRMRDASVFEVAGN